jgi:hypothetical protein
MSQGCHTRAKPFASALAGKLSSAAEAVLHFCKHDPASLTAPVHPCCAYALCVHHVHFCIGQGHAQLLCMVHEHSFCIGQGHALVPFELMHGT